MVDDKDTIKIHDWELDQSIVTFKNNNPGYSRVSSLLFINESDSDLIMVGSSRFVLMVRRWLYKVV